MEWIFGAIEMLMMVGLLAVAIGASYQLGYANGKCTAYEDRDMLERFPVIEVSEAE